MKNVINVDSLKMEIEKRVHVAMIHARNTKQEPSIMPMLHDTVNIIMEATHSLLISKLPEKKYIHHVWEGGDNPEDCKRLNKEITAIRDNVIDDMRKSIDELFGVDDE